MVRERRAIGRLKPQWLVPRLGVKRTSLLQVSETCPGLREALCLSTRPKLHGLLQERNTGEVEFGALNRPWPRLNQRSRVIRQVYRKSFGGINRSTNMWTGNRIWTIVQFADAKSRPFDVPKLNVKAATLKTCKKVCFFGESRS